MGSSQTETAAFAAQVPARVSRRAYPIRAESEGPRALEGEGQ